MKAQDLTKYDNAARRCVSGVDDLQHAALHLCGRLGYTGRANDFACEWVEARKLKFVDIGGHLRCGDVGLPAVEDGEAE